LPKFSKLAEGALDLHSKHSQVGIALLAARLAALGAAPEIVGPAERANTAMEILRLAEEAAAPLATKIADEAKSVAQRVLADAPVAFDVLVFDRQGRLAGRSL
jgi:cobalt-precorrin-5B (C1)-methyltransferase